MFDILRQDQSVTSNPNSFCQIINDTVRTRRDGEERSVQTINVRQHTDVRICRGNEVRVVHNTRVHQSTTVSVKCRACLVLMYGRS